MIEEISIYFNRQFADVIDISEMNLMGCNVLLLIAIHSRRILLITMLCDLRFLWQPSYIKI